MTCCKDFRARALRVGEENAGHRFLDLFAAIHEDDSVGDLPRETRLMGDAQHGYALRGQFHHGVEHLLDHLGVQRRGRLVEEHHPRLHAQRPRDGDVLLLAAGKLAGMRTLVRQCMARSSASALPRPRDLRGAMVQFSKMVNAGTG
ncbi:hypothetical protein BDD41_1559 [Paracoccus versutus]|uniref:Uncharacterized protein n=1 Tax=Paracoccus versutus TaxID=34007 RepID=A0A3D9XRH5_PARVE|nr:hypothetical protein BDD41_1559 [Paracoccus versutus]